MKYPTRIQSPISFKEQIEISSTRNGSISEEVIIHRSIHDYSSSSLAGSKTDLSRNHFNRILPGFLPRDYASLPHITTAKMISETPM